MDIYENYFPNQLIKTYENGALSKDAQKLIDKLKRVCKTKSYIITTSFYHTQKLYFRDIHTFASSYMQRTFSKYGNVLLRITRDFSFKSAAL